MCQAKYPLPVINITVSEAEDLHVVHHIQAVPQRLQLHTDNRIE